MPVVLLLCLLARTACAQTARPMDVSGGYSVARDPRDAVTLPAGWVAGAAVGVGRSFALVADVSGQYKTVPLVGSDAHLSIHTVMGGSRASARVGRLTEFGQVLAGVVRAGGSAFGSSSVNYSLGIQPGVGVDYPLTRAIAARAEMDVRLILSQPNTSDLGYQYRLGASLVYRILPR